MAQKPLSILISGAGVAGSSLALMAACQPLFNPKPIITLLERSATPRTTGQAIDIRGPAVRVIRQLGLEKKIKELHTTELGIIIVNARGKNVAQFDASGDADKQAAFSSEYEILRGDLTALLLQEIEAAREGEQANVKIVYGESIDSLKEHDDGVAVKFGNGKLEPQKYDVVVAADGMSSRTRPMIFKEQAPQECTNPIGMFIAYFTIPRIKDDDDYWRWRNVPGGLAAHIRPHRNKTTMGVYLSVVNAKKERLPELDEVLSKDANAQKAFLRKRFEGGGWKTERLLDGMDQCGDFYMQQVAQIRMPNWTKGRCAIVGDSAFATMGIGTSLAMTGAYIIAGELAKMSSTSSEDISAALGRYEEIFRPYVDNHTTAPLGFPQFANPQTKFGIGVLHAVLKAAYWTRLDKLFQGLGDTKEEEWKLPDYRW
ncbi:FAD/NAD(P)-binding domain-containing protein [Trematosphaeria pertusa]|uniref:FAD/NAD(P)-binding domain-containing protein n=1 Tax=Trematosphaeria pertusa TaxID=390896 RepID=A0A6A6IJ67_9PLEO|nr:FAD/NAD(P)-binding domain-containing protein [Trematosphaeria pertusa]KAF2249922.1 FAD/NAD(P)-binding domain-containing protein [Trematosphaeria pertusa]